MEKWHTNTEIPNDKDRYIIKFKGSKSYKLATGKEWVLNRLCGTRYLQKIERWAYIKDFEVTSEQHQEKQIDWEQRRYDIAKNMLCAIYVDDGNESRCANHNMNFVCQSFEGSAKTAVRYADALIKELKQQDNE